MNKTTAYLLATALAAVFVSTTSGCAALITAGADAAYESSEEKHLRRDQRHVRRGQPLRYHKSEQELQERQQNHDEMKRRRYADDDC